MKQSGIILTVGLLLLACSEQAGAQAVAGQLEGWLVGDDGAAIPGALVTARAAGFRERSLLTDARGYFRFLALPPGAYDVDISYIGREPVHVERQAVHIAETTTLGRLVAIARPIALDSLSAVATRPLVDPASSKFGALVARESFEHLPIDRDYHMVTALLPHVTNSVFPNDGLNFAGATGLENHFYVDGANTTGPTSAKADLRLPYNFIKEIEVRTGGYEAEYRGALGGIINVVTQSGTNDLRVEGFGAFAGDRFGPRPSQTLRELSPGEYSLYDVGVSAGGPIRRDRMWFFAAWNPSFETQDVALLDHGTVTGRVVSHRFAGKITWQPAPQTRFEFDALGNPTFEPRAVGTAWDLGNPPTRLPQPDPLQAFQQTGAVAFAARGTHFLAPGLLLEGAVNHSSFFQVRRARSGDSHEPLLIDEFSVPGEIIWTGGYPEDIDVAIGRTAGEVRLTAARGAHQWKVGADLERTYSGGRDNHARVTHEADGSWSVYRYTLDGDPVADRGIGVFAQDSWSPGERWRINYGVRWGGERMFASDGTLAAKVRYGLSPRLGLIYQPGELGHAKISASYGRFYQQTPVNAPQALYTVGARTQVQTFDHDPRLDPTGGTGSDDVTERTWGEAVQLRGLYFDEWTLGYERLFGTDTKATIRGIRRALGTALEDGAPYSWDFSWGNPGYGRLSFLPRARRTYSALELSTEHTFSSRTYVLASYVLSRTYGNYTGFFASDYGYDSPNFNSNFDQPEMVSSGLLPNDRTHVLKAAAWYRLDRVPLTLGGSFLWESGTPRSELGGTKVGAPFFGFVGQRGSAGRTPAVRDLDVRASYRLPPTMGRSTLLLDLFHVAGSQTPLLYNERHYRALDEAGNQTDVNPDYGLVKARAAKMAGRIGIQVAF